MTPASELQFYLGRLVDIEDLRIILSDLLSMKIETVEHPLAEATAFMMTTDYAEGFPLGVNVSWRNAGWHKRDRLEIARQLARYLNTNVATDLPEDHPSFIDPYVWCVAEPDGTLTEVSEEISYQERGGLVLDPQTRKVITGRE